VFVLDGTPCCAVEEEEEQEGRRRRSTCSVFLAVGLYGCACWCTEACMHQFMKVRVYADI